MKLKEEKKSYNLFQNIWYDMLVKSWEGKYYELWNAQAQYYNEG